MNRKLLALLVEDMEDLSELMVRELQAEGWETTVHTDLGKALERMKQSPYFDMVFLDLNLPGYRPPETIALIPDMLKYSPVAVVSGYDNPEYVKAVEATGAVFISKRPEMNKGSFLKTIVKTLGWYRTDRSHRIRQELNDLRTFLLEDACKR